MERPLQQAKAAFRTLGPSQLRRTLPYAIGVAWLTQIVWESYDTFYKEDCEEEKEANDETKTEEKESSKTKLTTEAIDVVARVLKHLDEAWNIIQHNCDPPLATCEQADRIMKSAASAIVVEDEGNSTTDNAGGDDVHVPRETSSNAGKGEDNRSLSSSREVDPGDAARVVVATLSPSSVRRGRGGSRRGGSDAGSTLGGAAAAAAAAGDGAASPVRRASRAESAEVVDDAFLKQWQALLEEQVCVPLTKLVRKVSPPGLVGSRMALSRSRGSKGQGSKLDATLSELLKELLVLTWIAIELIVSHRPVETPLATENLSTQEY